MLVPALALAQIHVDIALPSIRFEVAPPLVVVAPGVQVVEDYGEEVFFVDGWYWCRREGRWFRTRDHRGHWVVVETVQVPGTIVKIPPGRYRHHKVGKKTVVITPSGEVHQVKVKKHGKGKH